MCITRKKGENDGSRENRRIDLSAFLSLVTLRSSRSRLPPSLPFPYCHSRHLARGIHYLASCLRRTAIIVSFCLFNSCLTNAFVGSTTIPIATFEFPFFKVCFEVFGVLENDFPKILNECEESQNPHITERGFTNAQRSFFSQIQELFFLAMHHYFRSFFLTGKASFFNFLIYF